MIDSSQFNVRKNSFGVMKVSQRINIYSIQFTTATQAKINS